MMMKKRIILLLSLTALLSSLFSVKNIFKLIEVKEAIPSNTWQPSINEKPLIQGKSKNFDKCGNNDMAQQLAKLIIHAPLQQRINFRCNKLLSQVAQQKAEEMSQTGRVLHFDKGNSPNDRLLKQGIKLPKSYARVLGNQVEAIAGGPESASLVFASFMSSKGHKSHLMAEIEFFQEQNEIGIGYAKNWHSPHIHYWAVYISKIEY